MKRIILSVSISLCCLFSSVVRGAAQEEPELSAADKTVNPSGAVISANIGFADDAKLYALLVAYEARVSGFVSIGGGMEVGMASLDVGGGYNNKVVGVFNPFIRVKANMVSTQTTPFVMFDAGFMVAEKNYGYSVVNGVSLAPALGVDIKVGKVEKLRLAGGYKHIIGTGKFDGQTGECVFVSLGCKF